MSARPIQHSDASQGQLRESDRMQPESLAHIPFHIENPRCEFHHTSDQGVITVILIG